MSDEQRMRADSDRPAHTGLELTNKAPPPLCLVCGRLLEERPKYHYRAPFTCGRNWCPAHGYTWEQARRLG